MKAHESKAEKLGDKNTTNEHLLEALNSDVARLDSLMVAAGGEPCAFYFGMPIPEPLQAIPLVIPERA